MIQEIDTDGWRGDLRAGEGAVQGRVCSDSGSVQGAASLGAAIVQGRGGAGGCFCSPGNFDLADTGASKI